MQSFLVSNAGWMLVLGFLVLGWAYYMASTIMMRGSIFENTRRTINAKAEAGSGFYRFVREMLGCLMCTATEAAIWTLGISTFAAGLWFGTADALIGAALQLTGAIAADSFIVLPWFLRIPVMAAVSFALSLAVAGEAWAIKTVVEHREVKFLSLREEYRKREIDLLNQINELNAKNAVASYEFDLS